MKINTTKAQLGTALILVSFAAIGISKPVLATEASADSINPHQAEIDMALHEKALLDAKKDLLKSKIDLEKAESPAFEENFGKKGTLTIDSADADKFHVIARAAEAFRGAAAKISQAVLKEIPPNADDGPYFTLLTDPDRAAVPMYWIEKSALDRLDEKIKKALPAPPPTPEAFGTLSGVGAMLSQIAQFGQLFRTDKTLSFSTAEGLPDDLLLELIAVELKTKVLYPTGSLDTLITSDPTSDFGRKLMNVISRRSELVAKGSEGATAVAELDAMATRLLTINESMKTPHLLTVLRGELVDLSLTRTGRRSVAVRVISKGGASMKTSSIWRSDRLYAAGGVVASYRLVFGNPLENSIQANVITEETGFVNVPLK